MGSGASSSSGQLAMKIAQKFNQKQENFLFFPHEFHQDPSVTLTHHFKLDRIKKLPKNPSQKVENIDNDAKLEENDEETKKDYIKIPFYDRIYIELIEKYYFKEENSSLKGFSMEFFDYSTEFLSVSDLSRCNEHGWTLLHSFCLPGVGGLKNSIVFNEFLEEYVSDLILEDDLVEDLTMKCEKMKSFEEKKDEIDQKILRNDEKFSIFNENNVFSHYKNFLLYQNSQFFSSKNPKKEENLLFLYNYLKKLYNKEELLVNNFHYESVYRTIEEIVGDSGSEKKSVGDAGNIEKKEKREKVVALLNAKTVRGPGAFHFGWTPLHM